MSVERIAQQPENISIKDVEKVAARILTTSQWIKAYGLPLYGIKQQETVRNRGKVLYESWRVIRHGHRYYVYLNKTASRDVLKYAERKGRKLDERALKFRELSPQLVQKVFRRLFTVKEWIECVGTPKYNIHDTTYVYQMCAERPNGQRGYRKYPAHLPQEWNSVRVGESWLIYHDSLSPRIGHD